MSLQTLNPYRSSTPLSLTRHQSKFHQTSGSGGALPQDTVTLSSAATEPKRNVKKMALFGAIGTALGVAAASIICPAAGVGALLFSGLMGGVGGAAIADGALKDAGTRPAKPFDPYNPSDVLDPWNLNHPQNPFNPLNSPK